VYTQNTMASLQKHRVAGRTYWRLVESRRIGGKPRPVPLLYLGSADDLLNRLLAAPQGELRLQSFQHGDVAALKAAADRLEVIASIDRHVPESARGLSVGTTLLLAAINRAIRPRSKRGWAGWAQATSLHRLFPQVQLQQLTSQFFWDQMHCVKLEALRAIEDELTQRLVKQLGIKLDTLFYDATNFFTFIASTNSRPQLAQRGHSKQKRADLRLFSLALLVSRQGHIPLCSHLYEGNRVDAKSFPDSLTRIRERLAKLAVEIEEITLVYDKGNLSKANQHLVDQASFSYVACLVPTHHPELLQIPVSHYQRLSSQRLGEIAVLRVEREIWGKPRTVLLFISEKLRQGQIRGLMQHVNKAIRALEHWKTQLSKPRSGPRTLEAAQRQLHTILSAQHLGQVLKADYDPTREGADRLHYQIDQPALEQLANELYGKRFLITDRNAWSDEQILLAYRGQSEVEEAFRQLKDDEHMAVRPQYHWTDQKICVHTFCCLLALLLGRVIEFQARQLQYTQGLSGLLEALATVRLAMVLRPAGNKGGRPRCQWVLEQTNPQTMRLFRHLVPHQPPFVYT
jgi:transposase